MGQKGSNLSNHDRHTQRGGSFHISNQASRRREAFKAGKKSHFSFGDEPHRHSVHHKPSLGSSRRQKSSIERTAAVVEKAAKPIIQSKAISTPEREYQRSFGSLGNIKQNLPPQRSLNVESCSNNNNSNNIGNIVNNSNNSNNCNNVVVSNTIISNNSSINGNTLNTDYFAEFALVGYGNRSQSPADSINRSLFGTSCSHHSSIKLSEEEEVKDSSYPTPKTTYVNVSDSYLSPAHSPSGYKSIINEAAVAAATTTSSNSSNKLCKGARSQSPLSTTIATAAAANIPVTMDVVNKRQQQQQQQHHYHHHHRANMMMMMMDNNNIPPLDCDWSTTTAVGSNMKRQTIPFNSSMMFHKVPELSQENLVAALLPPSPLSQKEKRGNLSPHKLSPYNLSPRSLSPSQLSQQGLRDDKRSLIKENINQTAKGSPNIMVSGSISPTRINIDFSPEDQSGRQSKEGRKIPHNYKFKSVPTGEYLSLVGLGGDLLSINSKSDTSLSSFSFHKTPSIGLSPTAIRENHFFSATNNNEEANDAATSSGKRIDSIKYNFPESTFSMEKSMSTEGIKSKSINRELCMDDKNVRLPGNKREVTNTAGSNTIKDGGDIGTSGSGSGSAGAIAGAAGASSGAGTASTSTNKPQRPPLTRGVSLLSQLLWPRSIPEELNSHACSEFQGHQLLSWLCHWCAPHMKTGHKSDLYVLGCQMCTCLIACQQLVLSRRKRNTGGGSGDICAATSVASSSASIASISGMNNRSQSTIFQPEQIYRWHFQRDPLEDEKKATAAASKHCTRCHKLKEELYQKELEYSYELQRLKQEQELEIFKVKNEGVMKVCQLNDKVEQLERQVEKYRILAGIEGLARQMWHEEAVAANSNLVMSKSPTLQSIQSSNNNNQPSNIIVNSISNSSSSNNTTSTTSTINTIGSSCSMKTCSTDTSDLLMPLADDDGGATSNVVLTKLVSVATQHQQQQISVTNTAAAAAVSSSSSSSSSSSLYGAVSTSMMALATSTSSSSTITASIVTNPSTITTNTAVASNRIRSPNLFEAPQSVSNVSITNSSVKDIKDFSITTSCNVAADNRTKVRLQRVSSITESQSIEEEPSIKDDGDQLKYTSDQLIRHGVVTLELVKLWLQLQVSIESIDLEILKTVSENIPCYSDVRSTGSSTPTGSSIGPPATATRIRKTSPIIIEPSMAGDSSDIDGRDSVAIFWAEICAVPHVEEKIQFIRRYRDHLDQCAILEARAHQFTYVAHFLQHSESLLHILMIVMDSSSNLRSADSFELSLSLEKLIHLKQMHSQKEGNGFLEHVIDRYIDTYIVQPAVIIASTDNPASSGMGTMQGGDAVAAVAPTVVSGGGAAGTSSSSGGGAGRQNLSQGSLFSPETFGYPLPEPSDLRKLTEPEMNLNHLCQQLDQLESNVVSLNHISRCILSCSRHSLVSADVNNAYSARIIQLIQNAETDYSTIREQITQCDKQYSILQKFFSTTMESTLFFNLWLDFSQEFKQLWIKKVMLIQRTAMDPTIRPTISKPIGAVVPRPINDRTEFKSRYARS